jgi:phosphoribosylformimino-5-aminoimidazole carboxamide ribotide isomerase
MEIIPAIDLIDGKCVRLTQGDYARKTVYHNDPLEVALAFEQAGIRRLHLVDLDGAKAGRIMNQHVLEKIVSNTRLIIDFGGGIKTDDDLRAVFDAGAHMAVAGSIAVRHKSLFHAWIRLYGPDKILPAADVKNGYITIGGWQESTTLPLSDFIRENMQQGIRRLFCTDVSKDGLLQGPSLELYKQVIDEFPELELIASGGVSSADDLRRLKDIGCRGAIVGKALYENRISMNDITSFLSYA